MDISDIMRQSVEDSVLNLKVMCVGAFEENCSVFTARDGIWIVDPGANGKLIASVASKFRLPPKGILLTHGHFDHIGAIQYLQKRWPDLPVYLSEPDFPMLGHEMNQFLPDYPLQMRPQNLRELHSAPELDFLRIIDTPGHTPGSVSFLVDSVLFSGDTLFAGSIGRTDFPGGSMAAMMRSLSLLAELPGKVHVVPGHGPDTTIEDELRLNPYLEQFRR